MYSILIVDTVTSMIANSDGIVWSFRLVHVSILSLYGDEFLYADLL